MLDPESSTLDKKSSEPIWVSVELSQGQPIQLKTNVAPAGRPLILWMLEQAKLLILTQPSDKEKAQIVKPNGFMSGMLKRMGK